jgi:hypothetical protein
MRRVLLPIVVLAFAATAAAATPRTGFYGCRTFTSQHPAAIVRPSSIVIACADANQYVTAARWTSWTSSAATGVATMHENSCTPSCAAGAFAAFRVRVALSHAQSCFAHEVFTTVSWRPVTPRPHGGGSIDYRCLSR